MNGWRFPRRSRGYGHWVLTYYRVANPAWRMGVNRVLGYRIGWFLIGGRWCLSLCKPQRLETQRNRATSRLEQS